MPATRTRRSANIVTVAPYVAGQGWPVHLNGSLFRTYATETQQTAAAALLRSGVTLAR